MVRAGEAASLDTRYSHGLYTWLLRIRHRRLEPEPPHLQIEATTGKSEDARRFGDVPGSALVSVAEIKSRSTPRRRLPDSPA